MQNSKSRKRKGLYWFRHDLRVRDNMSLTEINQQTDNLICVFIIDPRWFKSGHFQSRHMGKFRWRFLQESLADLQRQLARYGQRLLIFRGQPSEVIHDLIQQNDITHIGSSFHPGTYERQQWQRLIENHPKLMPIQHNNHCLFDIEQLPFELRSLPKSFTPFRKQIESTDVQVKPPAITPSHWASPVNVASSYGIEAMEFLHHADGQFAGGTNAANEQIQQYFWRTQQVSRYKKNRNALDGWENSSKLSPWLANGSISVRQVVEQLHHYEVQHGGNESTYWLWFELLWREYFQWYLTLHQSALFRFSGVQDKRPLTTLIPGRLAQWINGDTPYALVNACMRQLRQTGYMSNRGRQLVASCLVNELAVDWRYGAAYFEEYLIDFDVAINWGNWQYLAGVGADPRGKRQFDIAKQTRQYDPNHEFINRWQGESLSQGIDATDAVDWPIT